jgi:polyphosphate kinase
MTPAEGRRPAPLLLNRELSWLAFNRRVLEEARDPSVPLLERLKFLSILSSNLDEFFMIRVAGLRQQVIDGDATPSPDGLTPQEQREAISTQAHAMVAEAMRTYREEIRPALAERGIRILDYRMLDQEQRRLAREMFLRDVFPVLTPLAVDAGHPFPHLFNRSLNIAVDLERGDGGGELFGIVQVPRSLDRLVRLPSAAGEHHFVLLGTLIAHHLDEIFPGHRVRSAHRFRVTRDADLTVEEEEEEELITAVERGLRRRDWGVAVRLEIESGMPAPVESRLRDALGVDPIDVYASRGRSSSPT